MDIGIIGLPGAGKTSLFNALTGGSATVGGYRGRGEANVGTVRVPDPRVDAMTELFHPKKTTYAEVRLVDYPLAAFDSKGPDATLMNQLSQMEALVLVARAFEDPSVPLPEGGVDAHRDVEAVELEIEYLDLAVIERRLGRLEAEGRAARATERGAIEQEQELLGRMRSTLEGGTALRALELNATEQRMVAGYQLLSRRPLLIVVNVGEDELPRAAELETEFEQRHGGPGVGVAALSAKIEAELAALTAEEAAEFRAELGLPEASPLDRVVQQAYALLGVHSFLTVGEDECRAWTLRQGATALEAAGRIHSDLERGFIRAEVARWDELLEAGSESALRKQGRLRTEGRDYVVEDGDVLHILFNV